MVQQQVEEFIIDEFGIDGLKIFQRVLKERKIKSLDHLSSEERMEFADAMLKNYPSFSRQILLRVHSEMLYLLGFRMREGEINSGFEKFKEADDIQRKINELLQKRVDYQRKKRLEQLNWKLEEKHAVLDFWSEVEKFYAKAEIMFNLFWTKANQAKRLGLSEEEILRVTNDGLTEIKQNIDEAYQDIMKKLQLENVSTQARQQFNFAAALPGSKEMEEEMKSKAEYKKSIDRFYIALLECYQRFHTLFNDSIRSHLLASSNQVLVQTIDEEMKKIYVSLENAYARLRNDLKVLD